jgi:hypothetical protein
MTRSKTSRDLQELRVWLSETTNPDDLREAVQVILTALGDRNISPASAGLSLQAIEDRRREIMYS